MVEVQKGSTSRVIFTTFRVKDVIITKGDIKTVYSNFFVSDGATPLLLFLQFKDEAGNITNVAEDPTKSVPSGDAATKFFFVPADTIWADPRTYTIIPFWTISTEKIFADNAIQVIVKDIHKGD